MPWSPKVLVHPAGIKNKPLFPKFLWDHKDSDGGLRRWPRRHKATQAHITSKSGVALRFPFELWVSVRNNSPFELDHCRKLAWRAEQYPAPIPPSFEVRASQKEQNLLPSSHLGRAGKRDLFEGGLFDTISSVARHRTAKRIEGFHGIVAFGSAYPLVSIANS